MAVFSGRCTSSTVNGSISWSTSRGAFANDRRIPTQIAAPYRIVHCRPNRLVGFMGRGR